MTVSSPHLQRQRGNHLPFLQLIYQPILLSSLITKPVHSIINQSLEARLYTNRSVNGDGFGVGYYPEDKANSDGPAIFTAITPAWSNMNLKRLAEKTHSSLIFAHVRASTSGALAEINCHPFSYHNLMWMHNGSCSLRFSENLS